MLPLQQANEVIQSIREYIRATFSFKNATVEQAFYSLIEDPNRGMIKGPYISIRTPFVPADMSENIPLEIKPNFTPHAHQLAAFKRLSTENKGPEPTLLTTGTGSGKTEAFEFPILDYCYKNRDKRGIKVIILYPMNALATDQAKRLAKDIWNDPRLKGVVRAGLFIGKGKDHSARLSDMMTENNIVEDRDAIVDNPPDILLTNFKMLDMGLMQSEYARLWEYNIKDPALLRFIVLDEIHTYDGAQGTDVANLLRRLKLKLNIPIGHLCPIGTSATLGSGTDAKQRLCNYASDIFGEEIDECAIIEEQRKSVSQLFTGKAFDFVPEANALKGMAMHAHEDYQSYIDRQMNLWDITANDDVELGQELAKHRIVRDLVEICASAGAIDIRELILRLAEKNNDFRSIPSKSGNQSLRVVALESLLSLIAAAKRQTTPDGPKLPFLFLQVQLWVRELSGIRRVFTGRPLFTWRDGKDPEVPESKSLPIWYCRDCGASGWYMLKNEHADCFETSDTDITKAVMADDKRIYLVCPVNEGSIAEDYKNKDGFDRLWIDPVTFKYSDQAEKGYIECWAARRIERKGNHDRFENTCPECNESNNPIAMVGTQTATLASLSVGQMLASDLENAAQRKILAFTNGVQDASHDASFFEARNFRFMFRTAVQKVVDKIGHPVSLTDLSNEFIHHWKNDEPGFDVRKYVYSFYPSDLEGRYPRKAQNIANPQFLDEFDLRMLWQIISEYGYGADIGRTLEKTGSSAIFFQKKDLLSVYKLMEPWIIDNQRQLNITRRRFISFLNGFLHRVAHRGGIDHPFLSSYRQNIKGFNLNDRNGHWLHRRFGFRQRWPQLVVDYPKQGNEAMNALDSTHRKGDKAPINWFHSYYERCFNASSSSNSDYFAVINSFYSNLLKALEQVGIMNVVHGAEGDNYALSPEHIYVSGKVKHYRCDICRKLVHVAEEDEAIENAPCLGHLCAGRYATKEQVDMTYYYNVYHRSHIPRVYAHEHTGMLSRERRELIEDSFIEQSEPDALNTLVATSTLEMGIDIGDLNSSMNISIPPTVANFTQRIGRAGRKSGASLIVNYAKRDKPHDLYYFSEPTEMMNGDVSTPGCFLEAREILARHFYAFCIDSWTMEDPLSNKIPAKMLKLPVGGNFIPNHDFFVNRLHYWICSNFQNLTNRFSTQYSSYIQQNILSDLFATFISKYLPTVINAFSKINKEYIGIKTDIKTINQEILNRQLSESDSEYIELKGEIRMLRKRLNAIDEVSILEFMTNSGILPNYAFPETGIKLNVSVKPDNDTTAGAKVLVEDEFELVRPASQGIKELAPGNTFFAQHYQLKIDGIVTSGWSDDDVVSRKRFCSECDCIMDERPGLPNLCPKCGSRSFGAATNIHTFIKLESVISRMKRKDAMADDRKDEREKKMYRMSRHFKFDEQNAVSFAMSEIPFGIQYVKNTELFDVNLGDNDVLVANNIDINGQQNVQMHGFIVCRHCGKVVNNPTFITSIGNVNERIYKWHYPFCRNKSAEYQSCSDGTFEEVYLYRRISTEAIKVLLPVGEIDTKAKVAMFKSGLMLGMRAYFGGEPSHIQISDYREMNNATGKWDNYLVIFDTIPGGSGYLAKLCSTDVFNSILKLAYEKIRDCECLKIGKDGCYHCILTYANQFEQQNLSREKAEEIFRAIVEKSEKWEKINGTLSGVNTSGSIEESELEERFIRTLKNYLFKKGGSFDVNTEFGVKYYTMKLNGNEYLIQPQYELNPSKGVKYNTIADFLITSPTDDSFLPIAIYLDGYRYHGVFDGNTPRFFHDYVQRESITMSNRFRPWTLTWTDLDLADLDGGNPSKNDSLYTKPNHSIAQLVKQLYLDNSCIGLCLNSFERLIYVLEHPKNDIKKDVGLMLIQDNDELKKIMFDGNYRDSFLTSGVIPPPATDKNNFFLTSRATRNSLFSTIRTGINGRNPADTKYSILLTNLNADLDKNDWEHFWRLHNVLSLLGPDAINEGSTNCTKSKSTLNDLIDAYDNPDLNPLIEFLYDKKIYINPDGYFVIIENDEIIAEALIGNEELKFAICIDDSSAQLLKSLGYNVFGINGIENLINLLKS